MRNRLWLLVVPVLLFSACGEEQYSTDPNVTPQAGGGPITGILINAQVPPDQVKLSAFEDWRIADMAGNVIFEMKQVTNSSRGITWSSQYADATGFSTTRGSTSVLGGNFAEVTVVRTAVSEDQKSCDFYLGDADAARLRGLPDLNALVRRGKFIILVGRLGE